MRRIFKRVSCLVAALALVFAMVPGSLLQVGAAVIIAGAFDDEGVWEITDDGGLLFSGTGEIPKNFSEDYLDTDAALVGYAVVGEGVSAIGNSAFSTCTGLTQITFSGSAPTFGDSALSGITAQLSYPQNDESWTQVILSQYGGTVTWVSYEKQDPCVDGHDYGQWHTTAEPMCAIAGTQQRVCKNCEAYETQSIPATGHYYTEQRVPASDATVGYVQYTCTECGYILVIYPSYTVLTYEDAARYLQNALRLRQTSVTIRYLDTVPGSSDSARALYKKAVEHNGVPSQGDYLLGNVYSIMCAGSTVRSDDGVYTNEVEFAFGYFDSASQEDYVDSAVARVMEELNLDGKSDLEKIIAINDYICDHVKYVSGTLSHTAYGALAYGQAVCQGYALLTYRLMLEAGIDCRYITGDTSGGAHGWNIVKLGDVYYNLDTTWNDPAASWQTGNEYFLLCDDNFTDHIRDAEYATEEFYAQYPMAQADFIGGSCGEAAFWSLLDGTLTIWGTGEMDKVSFIDSPWEDYRSEIQQVVIEEGITGIADSAFEDCANLTSVTIPVSVSQIKFWAFDDCTGLTDVYYAGSRAQWARIAIGSDNESLTAATIHYADNSVLCGDFDNDGMVSDADAIYLLRHTLFPQLYPVFQEADMNSDKLVSDADAIYLLRHTLFPETYPLPYI